MPNYKMLPMESHHTLTRNEYGKSSSYLMLLQQALRGMSDWSLIMKCSQFLSVAMRKGKGTNQEHFTKGRQLNTDHFLSTRNFTLNRSEQEMLSRFLPGVFLVSPSCTFCNSQPKDRLTWHWSRSR